MKTEENNRHPETAEELFSSLFISQATKGGIVPWRDFQKELGWRDAAARLRHFEEHFEGGVLEWVPFNGNPANDGVMSMATDPGRALEEAILNGFDALIARKVMNDKDPNPPSSPRDAVERYWGVTESSYTNLTDAKLRAIAKEGVNMFAWVKNTKQGNDPIYEIRDYGIGMAPEEMPDTILSLNRGHKKSIPYLTGKHGQGSTQAYQFSRLSAVASRKQGSDVVGYTFVKQEWEEGSKTPTFKYLTVGGSLLTARVTDKEFKTGTTVRHIGYHDKYNQPNGERSLYSLMQRLNAETLLPFWIGGGAHEAWQVPALPLPWSSDHGGCSCSAAQVGILSSRD